MTYPGLHSLQDEPGFETRQPGSRVGTCLIFYDILYLLIQILNTSTNFNLYLLKDVCIYIYTYGKIYKYYTLKYLSLFIMVNGRVGLGIN